MNSNSSAALPPNRFEGTIFYIASRTPCPQISCTTLTWCSGFLGLMQLSYERLRTRIIWIFYETGHHQSTRAPPSNIIILISVCFNLTADKFLIIPINLPWNGWVSEYIWLNSVGRVGCTVENLNPPDANFAYPTENFANPALFPLVGIWVPNWELIREAQRS